MHKYLIILMHVVIAVCLLVRRSRATTRYHEQSIVSPNC